jgi:hypothetical protein
MGVMNKENYSNSSYDAFAEFYGFGGAYYSYASQILVSDPIFLALNIESLVFVYYMKKINKN